MQESRMLAFGVAMGEVDFTPFRMISDTDELDSKIINLL